MKTIVLGEPLYKQVYDNLKNSIINGKLKSGQKIIVSELAENLNISRTPVREAVRQLEKESLIVNEQNDLIVTKINEKEFEYLYMARILNEKEAMKNIVDNITNKQLKKIKVILQEIDVLLQQEKYEEIIEKNSDFHDEILEANPNKFLTGIIKKLRTLLFIYRANILKTPEYMKEIKEEHNRIYQALLFKNKDMCVRIMEKHLENDIKRGKQIFKK